MFRTSICPSSGVRLVYCCMWCSALGVVAVVLRSRCVVLCTVCEFVSVVASSWYLSSFSYMMHGHTYIKYMSQFILQWRWGLNFNYCPERRNFWLICGRFTFTRVQDRTVHRGRHWRFIAQETILRGLCHRRWQELHIQGVQGGMWNTSGECSLC